MTGSETITRYYRKISDVLVGLYRDALECNGRIQYIIYIWEDGEIRILEDVQGGNNYLVAREGESRELYYVTTISEPFFDPWDFTDHSAPANVEEREKERQEIIDSLVEDYESRVFDILDSIIDQNKEYEELMNYGNNL